MSNLATTASEPAAKSTGLLDAVHAGKIAKTWNSNECGILWECLWKWTPEHGYQNKTCASGLFCDWHTFASADDFVRSFNKDSKQFRSCI
jgi:hypothetical protein